MSFADDYDRILPYGLYGDKGYEKNVPNDEECEESEGVDD